MDKLDRTIAEKRGELEQLRAVVAQYQHRAELAAAELRALEMAAQMRPVGTPDTARKGRQVGAISRAWRDVLRRLYLFDERVSYERIAEVAKQCGIAVEIGSVRERIRRFQEVGFIGGDPESGFWVTKDAVERFDLSPEAILEGMSPPST